LIEARRRRIRRLGESSGELPIVELQRDLRGFRVTEVARLFASHRGNVERMRAVADLDVLPKSWRDYFRKRVDARAA
jgi:hypothetical protein